MPLNVLPDCVSVIAPLVAVKLALLGNRLSVEVLASCVMLPDAVPPRVPVSRLTFPITNTLLLFTAMLNAPVLMSDTRAVEERFHSGQRDDAARRIETGSPAPTVSVVLAACVMFPVVVTAQVARRDVGRAQNQVPGIRTG